MVAPRSLPLQGVPERSPDFPGNLRGAYRGDLEEGSQSENPPSRSAPSILSRRTRSHVAPVLASDPPPRRLALASSATDHYLRVRLGVYPREVQRSVAESARKHEPRLHHRVGADWKKRRATFHQDRRHCPPENGPTDAEAHTPGVPRIWTRLTVRTRLTLFLPRIGSPCSPGISLEDA